MAYPQLRSRNAELAEGMSDRSYKKVDSGNRGGVVGEETYQRRMTLDDAWYGIHERDPKVLGDGSVHATPDFVSTPEVNRLRF